MSFIFQSPFDSSLKELSRSTELVEGQSLRKRKFCIKAASLLPMKPSKSVYINQDMMFFEEKCQDINNGLSSVNFFRKISQVSLDSKSNLFKIQFSKIPLKLKKQQKAYAKSLSQQLRNEAFEQFQGDKSDGQEILCENLFQSFDEIQKYFCPQNTIFEILGSDENSNEKYDFQLKSYVINKNMLRLMGLESRKGAFQILNNGIPIINEIDYNQYGQYILTNIYMKEKILKQQVFNISLHLQGNIYTALEIIQNFYIFDEKKQQKQLIIVHNFQIQGLKKVQKYQPDSIPKVVKEDNLDDVESYKNSVNLFLNFLEKHKIEKKVQSETEPSEKRCGYKLINFSEKMII